MKKIISLFKRDHVGSRLVYNEVVEGAEWVMEGKGVASRKWDGTCCMVDFEGEEFTMPVLYKRFDVKKGKKAPDGFIPAQDPDEVTGHWPGWIKVGVGPEDRWHREGFANWEKSSEGGFYVRGTYELCGPMVNGNPEHFDVHVLVKHGTMFMPGRGSELALPSVPPVRFDDLREWFKGKDIEGLVWSHPRDGRMVKIKKRDFGMKREE